MPWYITILTSMGTSVITCLIVEAYHQRRAADRVHDHDLPGDHRAGS